MSKFVGGCTADVLHNVGELSLQEVPLSEVLEPCLAKTAFVQEYANIFDEGKQKSQKQSRGKFFSKNGLLKVFTCMKK